MKQLGYKQANRRYVRAFWPMIIVYVVICFAAPVIVFADGEPSKLMAAAAAVLNGAPVAGVFWLKFRAAEETDEYTRLQHLRAMAFGGAVAVSLGVIGGFLQLYQVAPKLWMFWVGPVYFFAYGVGQCWMRYVSGERAA